MKKYEVFPYLNEDEILDFCDADFSDVIKERGINYFNDGKVIKCLKTCNGYSALVLGNKEYRVHIDVNDDLNLIDYRCSCPCDFPCKHAYATLISISKHMYERVSLLPNIKRNDLDLADLIRKVPAKELKEYILVPYIFSKIVLDEKDLYRYFDKYLPKQKYKYYYNNLYNALTLKDDIPDYTYTIIDYFNMNEFAEVFKIIKAIINAFKDTNNLNNEIFIKHLPHIEMNLRIIYRKADDELKKDIDLYLNYIKENNYFNSIYLEDLVLTIK